MTYLNICISSCCLAFRLGFLGPSTSKAPGGLYTRVGGGTDDDDPDDDDAELPIPPFPLAGLLPALLPLPMPLLLDGSKPPPPPPPSDCHGGAKRLGPFFCSFSEKKLAGLGGARSELSLSRSLLLLLAP